MDFVIKDVRDCQFTQSHELKQDIIDIYTRMQTIVDHIPKGCDQGWNKPQMFYEQVAGRGFRSRGK